MATATAATAATATATATATAMEEEECDRCDGADPQRRLDNSLLRLADVRLIAATTVGAAARRRWSPATATTAMPAIDIGALFIGREDREGDNGSGIATEDDEDAGSMGTITWRSSFADFGRGVLGGGGRQQRQRRRAVTTSTKKTS